MWSSPLCQVLPWLCPCWDLALGEKCSHDSPAAKLPPLSHLPESHGQAVFVGCLGSSQPPIPHCLILVGQENSILLDAHPPCFFLAYSHFSFFSPHKNFCGLLFSDSSSDHSRTSLYNSAYLNCPPVAFKQFLFLMNSHISNINSRHYYLKVESVKKQTCMKHYFLSGFLWDNIPSRL